MPPEGIRHVHRSEVLSFEEIERLAVALAEHGVTKIRLTGGEPTLRRDLPDLVRRLRAIRAAAATDGRLEVYMTSNGVLLEGLAGALAEAGLNGLTVSLDTLDAEKFHVITRAAAIERVFAGIKAALDAGQAGLKLNTVAIRDFNDGELHDLCRFAWAHGMTPRFIETMPMAAGALYVPGELMPAAQVRAQVAEQLGGVLEPHHLSGGEVAGPATYWRVRGGADDGSVLGTIGAMTENFCERCNRLRISARGQLHGCLAYDDAFDLRRALRDGEEGAVRQVLGAALGEKRAAHDFRLDGGGGPAKPMIGIGG
jgi:cyclic pyranopterin phosphate synthase